MLVRDGPGDKKIKNKGCRRQTQSGARPQIGINEVAQLKGATYERSCSMPEEFKPRFDGTINLGHLMSLGGILLVAISGYYSFSSRLSVVEGQLTRIAAVLENSIRQDEQIKNLTYRMDKVENARAR